MNRGFLGAHSWMVYAKQQSEPQRNADDMNN